MREIKFRAKRYSNGRWRKWHLLEADETPNDIRDETVGQYTGLKDKNGVEIYEGDIVKGHVEITSPGFDIEGAGVMWWHSGWVVGHDNGDRAINVTVIERVRPIEVIGNIYENPELLK